MAEITLTLSDRVAEAVERYGIPASSVCQAALEREIASNLPLMSLTPRARDVLRVAAKEAARLGHDYLGTEHLLLAVLKEGEGIAALALTDLGVAESVREKILDILASPGYSTGRGQTEGLD